MGDVRRKLRRRPAGGASGEARFDDLPVKGKEGFLGQVQAGLVLRFGCRTVELVGHRTGNVDRVDDVEGRNGAHDNAVADQEVAGSIGNRNGAFQVFLSADQNVVARVTDEDIPAVDIDQQVRSFPTLKPVPAGVAK